MTIFNGKDYFEVDEEIKISAEEQISLLKQQLADTNDKIIEHAEGFISDEDYAEIKAQRQAWRDEINRLESEEQDNE